MAAPFTSMLKIIVPLERLTPEWRRVGDGEVDEFSVGRNDMEHAKKSEKSKSKKTFESQNLAKLEKKLSKSGNSTNFDATEDGSKFLTLDTKTALNHWLAFIEIPIL